MKWEWTKSLFDTTLFILNHPIDFGMRMKNSGKATPMVAEAHCGSSK